MKGVRSGVERRRGASGLKPARDPDGRRDATGDKVLKKRRSPRRRGRMGTSVRNQNAPKNWMMMPGRMMSIVSVSLENLLMTRPLGVVSKNAIGNFITRPMS